MRRFDLASLIIAGLLSTSVLAACGGDDGTTPADPDAAGPSNEGFITPTAITKAYDNGVEVGPADWTCLNTPTADAPSTQDIMLSGKIRDFQTPSTGVPNATVTAFPGIMLNGNLGTAMSSSAAETKGDFSMTLTKLPAGETRYGFKIDAAAANYKRTYLLNQYFDPTDTTQTRDISAVAAGTATAVLAFVGATYDPTTGTLAGAFRDCQDHEVANVIGTVSSESGRATHLDGANTFYFGRTTGLPARHNVEPATSQNGLFVVINLPPRTTPGYIQLWGFPDQAALDAGNLTLLSELPSPVEADAVITGSFEPLRN